MIDDDCSDQAVCEKLWFCQMTTCSNLCFFLISNSGGGSGSGDPHVLQEQIDNVSAGVPCKHSILFVNILCTDH